jgi:hypothetical protein
MKPKITNSPPNRGISKRCAELRKNAMTAFPVNRTFTTLEFRESGDMTNNVNAKRFLLNLKSALVIERRNVRLKCVGNDWRFENV